MLCFPWVEPADLACWDTPPAGVAVEDWQVQLTSFLDIACAQLTTISGIGICEIVEVPCRDRRICCGCECVSRCDLCGRRDALELRGPVVGVDEVTIGGVVQSLTDFDVVSGRWLYRLPSPWPSTLALHPPTVTVRYRYGVEPSATDISVLNALVCAWATPKNSCNPPVGVTSISRRGITWATQDTKGRQRIMSGYGLPLVDAWMTAVIADGEMLDSEFDVTLPSLNGDDTVVWHPL